MNRLPVNHAALSRVALPGSQRVVSLAQAPAPDLSTFTLGSIVMTRSSWDMVGNLGYGSSFSGGAGAQYSYFLVEFLVSSFVVGPSQDASTQQALQIGQGWGMGFRGIVQVTSTDVQVTANLASIAAHAELQAAATSCVFTIIGTNGPISGTATKMLPSGKFDSAALQQLSQTAQYIGDQIVSAAADPDPAHPLASSIVYVDDNLADTLYQAPPKMDATIGYALSQISKGNGYAAAIAALGPNAASASSNAKFPYWGVSTLRVAAVYDQLLGGYANAATGPGKAKAGYILNLGS